MIKVDETDPIGELAPTFPYREVDIKRGVDMKQFFDLQGEIGRGKFGTVYKCREKTTGFTLAAKFVGIARRQDRKNVEREVEIMRALQHPRLIQIYDAYETDNVMCVILELIEGGELFERVIDDDFILTERACTVFMRQICEGVAFIHSKNIIHLDLKPENILCLTKTGNRIKIIDFGLARKFEPGKKLQVLFGTPEFVAPEVVNFDQISYATDMWSVGVICYVLLSGLSPFMGNTDVETMANVTVARFDFDDDSFDEISADAKNFISKLLVKDKEARLTALECLSHPWLRRQKPPPPPALETTKENLRNFVDKYVPYNQNQIIVNSDYIHKKPGLIEKIIENEQKVMGTHTENKDLQLYNMLGNKERWASEEGSVGLTRGGAETGKLDNEENCKNERQMDAVLNNRVQENRGMRNERKNVLNGPVSIGPSQNVGLKELPPPVPSENTVKSNETKVTNLNKFIGVNDAQAKGVPWSRGIKKNESASSIKEEKVTKTEQKSSQPEKTTDEIKIRPMEQPVADNVRQLPKSPPVCDTKDPTVPDLTKNTLKNDQKLEVNAKNISVNEVQGVTKEWKKEVPGREGTSGTNDNKIESKDRNIKPTILKETHQGVMPSGSMAEIIPCRLSYLNSSNTIKTSSQIQSSKEFVTHSRSNVDLKGEVGPSPQKTCKTPVPFLEKKQKSIDKGLQPSTNSLSNISEKVENHIKDVGMSNDKRTSFSSFFKSSSSFDSHFTNGEWVELSRESQSSKTMRSEGGGEENPSPGLLKQSLKSTPPWFSELRERKSREEGGRRSSDFSCFLHDKEDRESLQFADELRKLSLRFLQIPGQATAEEESEMERQEIAIPPWRTGRDPIRLFLENHGICPSQPPRPKFKFSILNRDVPIGSPPPPNNVTYYLRGATNRRDLDSHSAPQSPRNSPERDSIQNSLQSSSIHQSLSTETSKTKSISNAVIQHFQLNKTNCKKSDFPI